MRASNTSSLTEVGGEYAIYVDPYSIESIAAGILKGLEDSQRTGELSAQRKDWARKFSWSQCARLTHEVYRSAKSSSE